MIDRGIGSRSLSSLLRESKNIDVETALLEIRGRSAEGGNVADVSSVFALLKAFKNGFDKVDVSLQAEVLRNVVAEIEVQKEGVLVKIFGLSGGNLAKKDRQ